MLTSTRIKLRAIEEKDLPLISAWRSDPEVYEYFYEYLPISVAQQILWHQQQLKKADEINFVVSLHDGTAIGTVSILHLDTRNRKAEWGRLIIGPKEYRAGGYGREVEKLILEYTFNHLNLNKLYCEVLEKNTKVINLHKKNGFKEEGRLREHIYKNGEYVDVVVLALLSEDYRNDSSA